MRHATIVLDPSQYGCAGDSPCGSSPSRTVSIETSLAVYEKAVTSSMHGDGEMATIATHQFEAWPGLRRQRRMEPFLREPSSADNMLGSPYRETPTTACLEVADIRRNADHVQLNAHNSDVKSFLTIVPTVCLLPLSAVSPHF